ncbi:BadF/BadG/BcrA/BcrD ATPase family protein [Paenibacillus abyssi]|uniref:N-acetylglucosamine kinase n=1 Tax=Paenibacillus abyssi TaxID=1340531 RepID=A0A917LEK7_9BACL|nr:BadF/BadG/BcrA/BcrD ATPase family protein [Paenibacillus abyssi]GGG17029.1 N-acetylglucosamine kinase [Paenibacillus abyssi]
MTKKANVILGIDGGGTHTRVMVSDLSGNVLSYIEKGSASIRKDLLARQNVNQAILESLSAAGVELNQVCGIAAGVAGYDSEADLEWVESLTAIEGLTCPKWHFNDAVAAHYGALITKPGIVAVSGTGSIILAMTEKGQYIRNYDFHHYSDSAARFIAYDAVYEVLAGNRDETDKELVQLMLQHWEIHSIQELSYLARQGFGEDRRARDKKFGQFAPAVTEAASKGSSVSVYVCDRAIHKIKVGIEMMAAAFTGDIVSVAFIGSVINSPYFNCELTKQLALGNNKSFIVVNPRFSPVTGSVLYAMNGLNIAIDDVVIHNLENSIHSQP